MFKDKLAFVLMYVGKKYIHIDFPFLIQVGIHGRNTMYCEYVHALSSHFLTSEAPSYNTKYIK